MRFYGAGVLFLGLVYSLPLLAGSVTLDRVRADQAVLDAAERDYRARADSLSTGEAADFSAYIERLRARLVADCASLRGAGVEPPGDVSCPQGMWVSPQPLPIDQDSERTRGERTGVLDAELQEGLGAFDDKLLREQARVKAQASRGAVNGTGGGAAAGAGDVGEAGSAGRTTGDAPPSDSEATAGGEPRPPGSAGGGAGRPAPVEAPPADIPDGSDDDVVARQLREAAEKETDPALKAKLWEEYRRYKRGTH